MGTESPSNQKTQEELFAEVTEALANGKDFSSIVSKAEIADEPTDPIEEEVVTEVPVVEDPPAEPVKEEGEKQTTSTEPPANTEEDWAAGLPDEVKAKVQALRDERSQLEHRVKSELGRLPHLQRKVDELSRQLSAPQNKPEKTEPAATKTSVTASKFAEKLAEARAVDPALADLIEATLEAMREEVAVPLREELTNEVNQTKALFADKEQEQLWTSEKSKLLQMVPQADDVFKHPLYKEWKSTLPQNMYNLASSIYADDVVVALEQFSKYVATVAPELVTPPQATPAVPAKVDTSAADKVAADRARKLNGTPPSTSAQSPKGGDGIPENPEELFKYVTEKIRKGESYKV